MKSAKSANAKSRSDTQDAGLRLDKWLWAARFYKTRSLAAEDIGHGRVQVNGQVAKASRELKLGDLLKFRQGEVPREVWVRGLSHIRGPAPQAQALYEETPENLALREKLSEARRLAPEPAHSLAQGRPTKQDRRRLADWNRWSAAADAE